MRRARLPALSSPSDYKPGFLREQSRVLGRQVSARVVGNPLVARLITRYFHRLYYGMRARTWLDTHWLGTPLLKCPLDLWIYQELLHEIRPHLIVETGTRYGGSAAYLASLCDLLDHGRVISIDIDEAEGRPQHPRIRYLHGSSTAPECIDAVKQEVSEGDRVLVILDSDHRRDHVLAELRAYADLVSPGSYLVVEDTNVNGHPVDPFFGPGPFEAMRDFLAEDARFEVDRAREKFYLTFNPSGYLRRVG